MSKGWIERLMEQIPGSKPAEGVLDTPEKVAAFRERMEAAREADEEKDEKARRELQKEKPWIKFPMKGLR